MCFLRKKKKGGTSSSPVSCTTPRTGVESGRSTRGQRCSLNGQVGLSWTHSAAQEALTQQTSGLCTVSICLRWVKKALSVCVLEMETVCRLLFRWARTGWVLGLWAMTGMRCVHALCRGGRGEFRSGDPRSRLSGSCSACACGGRRACVVWSVLRSLSLQTSAGCV